MSREPKDKQKAEPKVERFNDVKFVNWSLSPDEKAACKAWELSLEDYDEALLTLVEAGYKSTVSYDDFRSCFTASIVPTKTAKSNQGYILTGKGSTPLKSVKQVLYIHYHIMAEEWAEYSTGKSIEELDD
jgi:hypothetical protein